MLAHEPLIPGLVSTIKSKFGLFDTKESYNILVHFFRSIQRQEKIQEQEVKVARYVMSEIHNSFRENIDDGYYQDSAMELLGALAHTSPTPFLILMTPDVVSLTTKRCSATFINPFISFFESLSQCLGDPEVQRVFFHSSVFHALRHMLSISPASVSGVSAFMTAAMMLGADVGPFVQQGGLALAMDIAKQVPSTPPLSICEPFVSVNGRPHSRYLPTLVNLGGIGVIVAFMKRTKVDVKLLSVLDKLSWFGAEEIVAKGAVPMLLEFLQHHSM
jgi:hypothetical protein